MTVGGHDIRIRGPREYVPQSLLEHARTLRALWWTRRVPVAKPAP
jgi:hypothetical protein